MHFHDTDEARITSECLKLPFHCIMEWFKSYTIQNVQKAQACGKNPEDTSFM